MVDQKTDRSEILRVAREGLGYKRLRPGQQAVIESILNGDDTLAVMPTGAGKSAIYQIAGALLPGATVVVSPLIALQSDQLDALEDQAVGEAAVLNSTVTDSSRRETFKDLEARDLEFIFLAPEQFNNEEVMDRLLRARPSLFVIDEAHCISEWGHDFRPEYLKLGEVIETIGRPTVLALTATASPPVRREIMERLGMRKPRLLVQGFDRPNIWLGVEIYADETAKQRALVERVSATEYPGIVYTATRKRAEEIAELLSGQGMKVAFYHAGMSAKERQRVQDAFMADELEVIVATIAYGMGVDKPNVRFVFHYDISESVDAYYQEIGRAGRDGEPAQARLFYDPSDIGLRRFFASSGQLDQEEIEQVAETIQSSATPLNAEQVQQRTDLSKSKVTAALNRLEEVGAVEKLPDGGITSPDQPIDLQQLAADAAAVQERRRQYDRSRVDMIRGYAELTGCRRQYLLSYFGDELPEPCGNCDNCDAGLTVKDHIDQPYPVSSRVRHRQWGDGQVLSYEGDAMVVLFDEVGYKTLAVEIVVGDGLLEQLG